MAKKITVYDRVNSDLYTKCIYQLLCDARQLCVIDSKTYYATRNMLIKRPESVENLLINVGYLEQQEAGDGNAKKGIT